MFLFIVPAALAMLLSSGCGDESAPAPAPTGTAPANQTVPMGRPPASPGSGSPSEGSDAAPVGAPVRIADLLWKIPADWESVAATGMRLAEYAITDPAGGGVASVRFFSTQGTAQMNIERWKGQVRDPSAGPDEKIIEADPIRVSVVAITGTYSGMGPTGAQTPGKGGTRLLAAYLEGGPRPVQVLVSGPDELVRKIEPAWEAMLGGVRVP